MATLARREESSGGLVITDSLKKKSTKIKTNISQDFVLIITQTD
jgi:hypothetical protein